MPKADATGRTGFSRLTGFKVHRFYKLFRFCNYVNQFNPVNPEYPVIPDKKNRDLRPVKKTYLLIPCDRLPFN